MQFIDKTLNQTEGHSLVDNFLNNQWNGSTYRDINYPKKGDSSNHPFKTGLRPALKQLLLKEQGNYCCYCMRFIDNKTTTLEHVVAKSRSSITQAILDQYAHYQIIKDYVCLQSIFEHATIKLATPPYPLEIAYENLTASCDGVFPAVPTQDTCNHKRKNDFVEPLFYHPTIANEVAYKNGGLMAVPPIYEPSIHILNLNHPTLKQIRKIWCHLSKAELSDIVSANTPFARHKILQDNGVGISLIPTFILSNYWDTLLKYKWFYNYYKSRKP